MNRSILILFLGLAASLGAESSAPEEGRSRFRALDIYLDSKGAPLAAFQLELAITNHTARIVGIEGGQHPAFSDPPFYDSRAIQHERVILAAFSTNSPALLPAARTRVATVHIQLLGPSAPLYALNVEAAADAEGRRILAHATCEERKTSEN
jgi:hypothetical protein